MGEVFTYPPVVNSVATSPVDDQPVYGPLTQAQSGRRHAVDEGQGQTMINRCLMRENLVDVDRLKYLNCNYTSKYKFIM